MNRNVGGIEPDWVAGISIGAINAAIIAGNPPHRRVERLNAFWQLVSSGLPQFSDPTSIMPWLRALTENGQDRSALNQFSAWHAAMLGIPGFFQPRLPPPPFQPRGTAGALSLYDTSPLRTTLESLIDFDLINDGDIRLSLGTVNVRTGNSHYFDNRETRIGPEHVMAFAPTRSGKGVGLVIPTLLGWSGSAVIHDIKGENWQLTAGWRARFARVLLFDPTNAESSAYNPLLEVRRGDAEVRELTAQTISRVRGTDEAREGFAAFLGKRAASWIPQ
mgnify:CR=1 FL=1